MFEIKDSETGELCRGVFYSADECHAYAWSHGMSTYTISKGGKVVETVGAA